VSPSSVTRRTILRSFAGLFILELTNRPTAVPPAVQPGATTPATPGEPTLRGYTKVQLEAHAGNRRSQAASERALSSLRETARPRCRYHLGVQDEDPSVRIAAVKSFVSLRRPASRPPCHWRIFWKQNRSGGAKADHLYPWADGAIRGPRACRCSANYRERQNLVIRVNASTSVRSYPEQPTPAITRHPGEYARCV